MSDSHVPKTSFKLVRVEPFGTWKWQHKFDTCSICKESINMHTPCSENYDIFEYQQSICIGECSHVFHTHCLHAWLQISKRCPLCNTQWRTEFETHDN